MIWGYGPVGYGAFRTKRVLAENVGAGQKLATVAKIARDAGGPEAFAWLAKRQPSSSKARGPKTSRDLSCRGSGWDPPVSIAGFYAGGRRLPDGWLFSPAARREMTHLGDAPLRTIREPGVGRQT